MLQLDTARKYYEKAIKLNPKYSEAINNLGTVYYAQEELPPGHQLLPEGAQACP